MSGKYESFAQKNLSVVNSSGEELMVRCLFHDDSNASMQFNIDSGLWICFGCGTAGNVKTLERELGIRATQDEPDVSDILAKLDALKRPDADVLPVLNESYLKRFQFPNGYWKSRGMTEKTVAIFELGMDPMGDRIMGPYASIPIRNVNGGLLGVIRRYTDPDAELKYKYPKGFQRSQNLFASWLVEQDPDAHTVVLTEGSIDAIKVWQAGTPAMAVYGSSIGAAQVRQINRLGITKVVLMFDNDKAGWKATKNALGIKERKKKIKVDGKVKRITVEEYDPLLDLSRFCIVKLARYRKDGPADPGDMSSKQIRWAIENARDPGLHNLRSQE